MANLTMEKFIDSYGTKYIADYGDIYITYDAVALRLAIPASPNDTVALTNSMTYFHTTTWRHPGSRSPWIKSQLYMYLHCLFLRITMWTWNWSPSHSTYQRMRNG